MLPFILRRLLQSALVMVVVAFIAFGLFNFTGDPVQFMVGQVNPRLGEKVLDPACGTGGFLSCALEHVRAQDVKSPRDEAALQASFVTPSGIAILTVATLVYAWVRHVALKRL